MGIHNTVLYASFDTSQFTDPESDNINFENDTDFPIINTIPASISFTISARSVNSSNTSINFTSNGIDGLGSLIDTFNIPKINFANQKVYFVARLKNGFIPLKREPIVETSVSFLETHSGESIKLMNESSSVIIDQGDLDLTLLASNNTVISREDVTFTSNFNDLTGFDGGFYKGFFTTPLTGKDFKIRMVYNKPGVSLSGISTPFDIYPSTGEYDVRKCNEDNDQTSAYKKLIFQESLLNKPEFFDGLLGQSVGNKNSIPETLGLKTFEKTSNFVSNITDIDFCNIKALVSIMRSMNINFENYNQEFPPSVKRLMDIFSVSISKQTNRFNQYQGNYDDKGYTGKTVFGRNKGNEIDIETGLLKTGIESRYILAYEKFSENYKLVNTNILSATQVDFKDANTYPLSSYNESWGWGLVMPKGTTGLDLKKYYCFYNYNNTIDGTAVKDFIDYTNANTTYLQNISAYEDAMGKDQIVDNILHYNLLTSCGFVDPKSTSRALTGFDSPSSNTLIVTISGGSNAINGDYIYNPSNRRWERAGLETSVYIYHDGVQWLIYYSGLTSPTLEPEITEEDGWWSVSPSNWNFSDSASQTIAGYLTNASYSINF